MEELGHLIKLRHEKLDDLREKGISPYINRFKIDTKIQTLVQNFSGGTKAVSYTHLTLPTILRV